MSNSNTNIGKPYEVDFCFLMTQEKRVGIEKAGFDLNLEGPDSLHFQKSMKISDFPDESTEDEDEEVLIDLEIGFNYDVDLYFSNLSGSKSWMPTIQKTHDDLDGLLSETAGLICNLSQTMAKQLESDSEDVGDFAELMSAERVSWIEALGFPLKTRTTDSALFAADRVVGLLTADWKKVQTTLTVLVELGRCFAGNTTGFYVSITDSIGLLLPIDDKFESLEDTVGMAVGFMTGIDYTLAAVVQEKNSGTQEALMNSELEARGRGEPVLMQHLQIYTDIARGHKGEEMTLYISFADSLRWTPSIDEAFTSMTEAVETAVSLVCRLDNITAAVPQKVGVVNEESRLKAKQDMNAAAKEREAKWKNGMLEAVLEAKHEAMVNAEWEPENLPNHEWDKASMADLD